MFNRNLFDILKLLKKETYRIFKMSTQTMDVIAGSMELKLELLEVEKLSTCLISTARNFTDVTNVSISITIKTIPMFRTTSISTSMKTEQERSIAQSMENQMQKIFANATKDSLSHLLWSIGIYFFQKSQA